MEIYISDKPSKRFMAIYKDKRYYFGSPTGYTFVDGADISVRDNYRKRHYANKNEKYKIDNLIPSPALFSYYITWGDSRSIRKNIRILNKML